jgi:fucose 4-O-acetylase-like acetyltransferase
MYKRNKTIDCMKGLTIILMVIGHMHLNSYVDKYIYSFHMPLFFIVSGCLYKPGKLSLNYVKKKAQNLLLPYFAFGGGTYVCTMR